MKRKIFYTMLTAVFVFLNCSTASAQLSKAGRSEIRVGWGDQGFETLAWHQKYVPYKNLSPEVTLNYQDHYRYTQHWFVDYKYNVKDWLGIGAMLDVSGVIWDDVLWKGDKEISRSPNHDFYNISIMPAVQFSYFRREYVSLHSGVAAGVNINTGSEIDLSGRKTALAPSLYLNFFGVSAGYKWVFASVDLGAMVALEDMNRIYMLGSRLLSVSVGVNF